MIYKSAIGRTKIYNVFETQLYFHDLKCPVSQNWSYVTTTHS